LVCGDCPHADLASCGALGRRPPAGARRSLESAGTAFSGNTWRAEPQRIARRTHRPLVMKSHRAVSVGFAVIRPNTQVHLIPVRRNQFLAATAFRASPYPPLWRALLTRASAARRFRS